jgi:hypothetical protein
MISENGNLKRIPQTVTKWFAPAPLDVASYNTELRMEITLWKFLKISRGLCEEVAALKGANAHILGTTALEINNFKSKFFNLLYPSGGTRHEPTVYTMLNPQIKQPCWPPRSVLLLTCFRGDIYIYIYKHTCLCT